MGWIDGQTSPIDDLRSQVPARIFSLTRLGMISRWLYHLEFLCFEVFRTTGADWYVPDDTDWIGNRIEPPKPSIAATDTSWIKELTGGTWLELRPAGFAPVLSPLTIHSNIQTFTNRVLRSWCLLYPARDNFENLYLPCCYTEHTTTTVANLGSILDLILYCFNILGLGNWDKESEPGALLYNGW